MHAGRPSARLATLVLAVGLLACTETDDALNTEVTVARLGPADPVLRLAALDDPAIQAVSWRFSRAEFRAGSDVYDLTAGQACEFFDSAVVAPGSADKCGAGVVVGQAASPLSASLSLELTMTMRRAKPIDLQDQDDEDGDGVANGIDLCPLIPDPGQEDADGNGIGDACEGVDPFTGEIDVDNDQDLLIDRIDNCVYIRNSDQRDTIPFDGIGDACDGTITSGAPLPEEAEVTVAMSTDLQLDLPLQDFNVSVPLTLRLVIDFSNDDVLTCDWSAGTCVLDPAAVQACYATSGVTAPIGCS